MPSASRVPARRARARRGDAEVEIAIADVGCAADGGDGVGAGHRGVLDVGGSVGEMQGEDETGEWRAPAPQRR